MEVPAAEVRKLVSEGMDLRFCLVGRFLTNKPISFVAMKTTMTSVWAPGKGLTVLVVGEGQYMLWLLEN